MRTTAAAILVLLLAACGGAGAEPTPSVVELDPSGSWRLVAGHGADGEIPLVDDHPITLIIEGSEIGGTAACNQYGGRFVLAGGTLSIGEMSMTAMGCDAPVAASEAAYVAALTEVSALRMDGAELILTGDGMELRFTPLEPPPTAELVGTSWVLETLFVGDVASAPMGDPALLELSPDGTFSGSTGCRTFTGRWVERGNQIHAPEMAMDGTECPPDLAQQDSHVVGVIGDGFVPTIEGELLTLTDPGGVGLVYRSGE